MNSSDWLEIDGSFGEGGGQIIRTSLGLSLCTGRPVHLTKVRAGRKRTGLLRQHLTAVRAATAIGRAEVEGDELGSGEIFFKPQGIYSGSYKFSVGSAGSTTLVFQAILPALLIADGPTELVLEGGTHNPMAPPFDFIERVVVPLVNQMGPKVRVVLDRPGFFPAGGGKLRAFVTPTDQLKSLWLKTRGEIKRVRAIAKVAALPANIGHRELLKIKNELDLERGDLVCQELDDKYGPGNVVCIEAEAQNTTELFTGFGQKGIRAEKVARDVSREARSWLDSEVPVGEHLADQLIPLMALAGSGGFRTLPLTMHAQTQVELVKKFFDLPITTTERGTMVWDITVGNPPQSH